MRCTVLRGAAALLLSATTFPGPASGAGFALMEQSASGLGNAFAGASAAAEDASTLFWNPAGMAKLRPGRHFAVAGHAILPTTRFHDGGSVAGLNRTDSGTEGGNAGNPALLPNFYLATDLGPRFSFGVGVNVPFGLATEYEPSWIGRFQGIRSEIETLNINPSISWKASDRLALGFGISWQRGEIGLLSAVNYKGLVAGTALNPLVPANAEGQNRVDLEGDAWGYNLGLQFDLSPATRLGMAYRSSVEYTLRGTTRFSGVPAAFAFSPVLTAATANGNVRLDVDTPDMASLAVMHRLTPRWDVLADVTWTGWSTIKALPVVRDTGTTLDTLRFNFRDTLRYGLGARYAMSERWTLKMGLAFDQSPVPGAADRGVRLPDNDRTWLALGARYRLSNSGAIDAGYSFVKLKDAPISNNQNVGNVRGFVNGTYRAYVNILGVQYSGTF
ncbi:MAG: hypothetical protein A3G80_09005 [Betaproteobacteria bacterium RIFCSPLOWO2_12_FULL_62_13b]|nr:MAG: hypothetical protein A3G80_09005 [Betaproteobacteria bacterium RIFCSPLOWO2_12_FULL_62_13b]